MTDRGRLEGSGRYRLPWWRWSITIGAAAVAVGAMFVTTIAPVRVTAAIMLGLVVGLHAVAMRRNPGWHPPPARTLPAEPEPVPPVRDYLTPTQLPPPPDLFVGRQKHIDQMRACLRRTRAGQPSVIVIRGGAGIGKSTVATQFAYLVADDFPDGQLFGRLDARAENGGVSAVLADFVQALLGPGRPVPPTEAERAARYAELTLGRRVLVILDNAGDGAAVRQLLPRGADCAAVITSRGEVPGVDRDLDLVLAPLSEAASLDLLTLMVGPDRVDRARDAARAIAGFSDHHPLALRLAGAALARRPHWDLDLDERRMREDRLRTGGAWSHFTGALDLSYALLADDERRALRLLGLLPTPAFAPWMLAALLGGGWDEEGAWLITDRLVHARLVERTSAGAAGVTSFRVLEHVQAYARARLLAETTDDERSVGKAALHRARVKRREMSAGSRLRHDLYVLANRGQLTRAMDVARDALALARENSDLSGEGLALATLAEFNAEVGNFSDAADLAEAALRFDSRCAQVRALRGLALISRRRRPMEEATRYLDRALAVLESAPEAVPDEDLERVRLRRDRAVIRAFGARPIAVLPEFGRIEELLRRLPEDQRRALRPSICWAKGTVLDYADLHMDAEAALFEGHELARTLDQQLWQAWLGHARARVALDTGDTRMCRSYADEALDLFAAMQHEYGGAHCRFLLGRAYSREHRREIAAAALEEVLETLRNYGDTRLEAHTLAELAEIRIGQERLPEADRMLRAAGRAFTELGDVNDRTIVEQRIYDLAGSVQEGTASSIAKAG